MWNHKLKHLFAMFERSMTGACIQTSVCPCSRTTTLNHYREPLITLDADARRALIDLHKSLLSNGILDMCPQGLLEASATLFNFSPEVQCNSFSPLLLAVSLCFT